MSTQRPTSSFSILIISMILMIMGAALIPRLPVHLLPTRTMKSLSVRYGWPGASPRLIEQEVTAPLEGLLNTIRGVTKISSVSGNGSGYINLAFDKNADLEVRRIAIKAMVVWGGSFSIPRLLELIKSDALVSDCCFKALASLNDPSALDGVAKLFMTDDDCSSQAGYFLDSYGEAAEEAVLKYFPPKNGLSLQRSIDFLKKHGTSKSLAALKKIGNRWDIKDQVVAAMTTISVHEKEKARAEQAK